MKRLLMAMVFAGAATSQPAQAQFVPPSQQPAAPPPAPSSPDTWLPRGAAELLLLDKLRAQPATLSIKAGQSETFGSLTITVRSCVVRPADQAQNAAVFLDIADKSGGSPAFHGWVLSNAPSVSQFENPVFDLRLAACR